MNEKDEYIIEKLLNNAKTPKTEIAKELGITEAAVRKRIKQMEDKGIILGYRAIVDWRKINRMNAFTGLDVNPENLLEVLNTLKEIEEVKAAYLTSGDHDILVEMICKDVDQLEEIHKRLAELPGVKRVCPSIVVSIAELK
ncbi:MAG TPA: Lrp/AsnC family transcriptional regulator [Euryarchaeota archaeon]|nr:MAG: transcriptional regulator [Thermococci archaeon]RLF94654.1 MAG: transcriptional regulator [Thermococci archaeon]HDI10521.1 Lrp/AsnC family transcriptional regulator [Euryarchaeota archaeon]